MWFRLFGGRSGGDDEQPTASPPPMPDLRATTTGAAGVTKPKVAAKRRAHDGHRKGFDPYNSGAFQRHAWERVSRD